jgi:2-polyprenyl-3-methyl-5-hydroxy-6-metoxy-1,4-benzoquinol methylase
VSRQTGSDTLAGLTRAARAKWGALAPWWDARLGEATNAAVRPAVERLLDLRPGERILEVACGNGALARRMAELGAEVVAVDFSGAFLRLAEERTRARTELAGRIDFQQIDATDERELGALGALGPFDAAVCVMGLMDMATVEPLLAALARLLRPGGRFVWAVTHPCFNSAGARRVIEEESLDGELAPAYSVKVARYLTPTASVGVGIVGQPTRQYSFDRPLGALLGSCFQAGFVLDGFEELGPPPPSESSPPRAFSWAHFREIPAFLVARARLPRT